MIKALKRLASKSLVVKEQKEDKDIPKGVCNISGGKGKGDPPVPMPNTEVKPFRADGTWLETARESRSLPDSSYSSIAQPVERSAVNRNVVGSSPTGGAIITPRCGTHFETP